MPPEEQVLVVERKVVEKLGLFNGLQFDVQRYLNEIFAPGTPSFKIRSEVEQDPSFKQLIPYVIMHCNGKYLSYVRGKRAGETRLIGNRSIGIGGHINPIDDMPLFSDLYQTYLTAVDREVDEEVTVDTPHTNNIVALLNDESNEVGSVHLGIVHFWNLNEPNVTRKEQMITQLTFMTPEELHAARDTLETWSALCADQLAEMEAKKTAALKIDTPS